MFGAIIFETMAIAAIFRLRWKRPDQPRPYRCWGYPVVPLLYVVVMALVLGNTIYDQPHKSAVGLGFIAAGGVAFLIVNSRRSRRPTVDPGQQNTEGVTPP
jgi:amino acid transporter